MASVELRDVWKRYGHVEAVKGVSMDIADGEFVALVGPSGCGKSSTMRMIAGLETITQGQIAFDDQIVNDVRPRDRNVAMAFETYALYPTLNVYENLAFPLRAAKWSQAAVDERVRDIASIVGITHLLDANPTQLSSGLQQSVGLARALTRDPSVFLLDEPISHLDTSWRTYMRAYLKGLHIELGYTMVYVTHDQEEAMALADRVAVMNDGEIQQLGEPNRVYENPANLFVASFIGEPPMNLLDCNIEASHGTRRLAFGQTTIPVPDRYLRSIEAKSNVTLGIRPFYVRLRGPEEREHGIAGTVRVVEPMGDMTVVSVDADGAYMQVVVDPTLRPTVGEAVSLIAEEDRVLLFDSGTGALILPGGATSQDGGGKAAAKTEEVPS